MVMAREAVVECSRPERPDDSVAIAQMQMPLLHQGWEHWSDCVVSRNELRREHRIQARPSRKSVWDRGFISVESRVYGFGIEAVGT